MAVEANHRLHVMAAAGLELGHDQWQVVGRVLGIDDEPVVPRTGDEFRREGARQRAPEAEHGPPRPELLLEWVLHRSSSRVSPPATLTDRVADGEGRSDTPALT